MTHNKAKTSFFVYWHYSHNLTGCNVIYVHYLLLSSGIIYGINNIILKYSHNVWQSTPSYLYQITIKKDTLIIN